MTTQVSGGWVAGSSPKVLQVTNRELCRKLAWTKECGGSALDAAKQTKSFAFDSLIFQPYVRQASSGRKDVCIEVYRPHCVVVDIDLPGYTTSTMVVIMEYDSEKQCDENSIAERAEEDRHHARPVSPSHSQPCISLSSNTPPLAPHDA